MTPIRPARVVGASILVEAAPLHVGFSNVYRGVDLGFEPGPNPSKRAAVGPTPYRVAPPIVPSSPSPVIVRERSSILGDEPWTQALFEKATLTRHRMRGSPAPQLLHTLGLGDKVLASVEDYLCGVTLQDVLRRLRAKGEPMPIAIALAITESLLPLWMTGTRARAVRFLLDPAAVILEATGRVRALPHYQEERARQVVGAAVALMSAPISYAPPEQILGAEGDARAGMFTLGLLLYEMIAGEHPLASADTTMFEILSRTAREDMPPLSQRRADVPTSVAELVHRCLARDPANRFDSWFELRSAVAALRALVPTTASTDIANHLRAVGPFPIPREIPIDLNRNAAREFPSSGYRPVPLPASLLSEEGTRGTPRQVPVVDPRAVYVGTDARPMFAANDTLLVDARPVTRAELERFFIVTGTPRPAELDAIPAGRDDEPCTFVSAECAEAYALWAGKRLPTDTEWEAAVAALGAARLDAGTVWEWTSTPHAKGGHVVRGGRWRDQANSRALPQNRSFETSPAADVGFRCVASPKPQ